MLNATQKSTYTKMIKAEAERLGFSFCGVAKADFLEEEAPLLERWLKQNMHGQMSYMENYFDLRLDPRKLVPGAKSVVSLLLNYFPGQAQTEDSHYKISKYAFGRDYHKVLKKKLKALVNYIEENIGEVNGRAFVDSAPVMDKAWAKRGGMGWIGKHSNLITKQQGSYFFISELILDLELEYNEVQMKDFCGTCNMCVEACPTDAIIQPQVVDGSKCISYFTIELKDEIPQEYQQKLGNWVFGCDICQDVCPWNRFSKKHNETDFAPLPGLMDLKKADWEEISEDIFKKLFEGSAVKRTKFEGLKRNIAAAKKNI